MQTGMEHRSIAPHSVYSSDEDQERAGYLAEVHSHGRPFEGRGSITQQTLDRIPDGGLLVALNNLF